LTGEVQKEETGAAEISIRDLEDALSMNAVSKDAGGVEEKVSQRVRFETKVRSGLSISLSLIRVYFSTVRAVRSSFVGASNFAKYGETERIRIN
jgi:hypothetical protein